MNVKTMLLPLALLASTVTSTADASVVSNSELEVSTNNVPNLCAKLDIFGHPALCEPVGPDMAPYWNSEVCCNADGCTEPGTAGCAVATDEYWCESAVLHSDGSLVCVYEVPSYCEVYACGPADIDAGPLETTLCCYDVGCYDPEGGPCGGEEIFCYLGASNEDGTVTCFEAL